MPVARFFAWFNRVFGRTRVGYVHWSGLLIRKSAFAILGLLLVTGFTVYLNKKLPNSFLPEEDQGYMYINAQLPLAASLDRTDEFCKKVENVLKNTPGIRYYTSVIGFSLLSQVQSTYNAFFFVTLQPWDARKKPAEQYMAIRKRVARELAALPEAVAFPFSPPSIPGVGSAGGFTFMLEDRSGSADMDFLTKNVDAFMEAARKRPELAGLITLQLPNVPQVFVNVDRDKVLKQGVNLTEVYRTMQAFMGGYFINYFNRFGRQWQVYVEAEGDYRTRAENLGLFYVRNHYGESVPLAALTSTKSISGPEFTMRYNLYRSAQINGAAGAGLHFGETSKTF